MSTGSSFSRVSREPVPPQSLPSCPAVRSVPENNTQRSLELARGLFRNLIAAGWAILFWDCISGEWYWIGGWVACPRFRLIMCRLRTLGLVGTDNLSENWRAVRQHLCRCDWRRTTAWSLVPSFR